MSMAVSPCCFGRIVDSYIRAIDLLLGSNADADVVLLLRFEGSFRITLDQMNIDWTLINFAFRDADDWWYSSRLASDLFFVLPSWHLADMRAALEKKHGLTPRNSLHGRMMGGATSGPANIDHTPRTNVAAVKVGF